jgi:uncharacterized membrane protein
VIAPRGVLIRPTAATRLALLLMVLVVSASAAYLILQYPDLPGLLPVRFRRNGVPNGWQYKTWPRVMMPVFIQAALVLTLGGIGVLLLSRSSGQTDPGAPDVRAAATASEAVMLTALIWVGFQGYAAVALVLMWEAGRGGLGRWYYYLQLLGFVLTGVVATRAHVRLGRPEPRPFVAEHWRFGQLYSNREDPALFVPTRDGSRWTLNFGRPVAVALLGFIIVLGILGPSAILLLALRS